MAAAFLGLAVLAYAALDVPVVRWIHDQGIDAGTKRDYWWLRKKWGRLLWPGHFFCTLFIAALLAAWHRAGWRASVLLLAAGAMSGLNSLIKWLTGRSRPDDDTGLASMNFEPLRGGLKGLFVQVNLAFPSGDVALAAATAACLIHLLPRVWPLWCILWLEVAAQRLAENAHHVSDVFAGTTLGIVVFLIARKLLLRLPAESCPTPPGQSTSSDQNSAPSTLEH